MEEIDFKALKISRPYWALAPLGILAKKKLCLTKDMLLSALKSRFTSKVFTLAEETIGKEA